RLVAGVATDVPGAVGADVRGHRGAGDRRTAGPGWFGRGRAGVAASFIDPLLLSGAEVTQGPASTYYGSGAIAGTIHLQTRQEDAPWMSATHKSDGDEWATAAGTGNDNYAISLAYRTRDNGETVDGAPKNNQFSQHSLNFVRHFELGDYSLDWQLIESAGDDIAKDNSRYPESRITSYPEEKHLLSQLTLSSDADWIARFYFHDQSLITQDIRPQNRINRVTTDSFDLGLSIEDKWDMGDFDGLFGFDFFGRRDVDSDETELDLETQDLTQFNALIEGEENESAIFVTVNRELPSWSIHGGVRTNYQSQKSAISETISDNFVTYFATVKKPIGDWNWSLSYGTGFRFASLSERLFNGTTARGRTIGNPDLKPEESRALDLSTRYQGDNLKIALHWFNTDVDNFIERISIDDDTRSFRNVTNGKLEGWQYEFDYSLSDSVSVSISGQGISGRDNNGNWLADIPAIRHALKVNYQTGKWTTQLSYLHRREKSQFGDGEIALDAADIIDAKVGYKLNQNWRLQFSVENLLDETYYNSADDLGTLAIGRNFGLSISYQ
ncbi:MAG: TonB-dependent receptor, partial [Kangiellaceae bacterium]|nr:TonB-dependent receptor [Kangiellaceae bacterium]